MRPTICEQLLVQKWYKNSEKLTEYHHFEPFFSNKVSEILKYILILLNTIDLSKINYLQHKVTAMGIDTWPFEAHFLVSWGSRRR